MKKTILFSFLLLASAFLMNCSKSINHSSDFERSQQVWLGFKKAASNSYQYQVVNGSWVGYSSATTIIVSNGRVIQRQYKFTPAPGNPTGIPAGSLDWTEDETQINTHPKSGAADAFTLDQIYDKAKTEWLIKRKDATTYFEAKNNGLISSCGYVQNGCQDDCFTGITIAYIQHR